MRSYRETWPFVRPTADEVMRLTALEPLGQPDEEGAAGTELRVADTHPRAVANLIDLIEQVEDVEAQLHSLIEAGVYRLNHAEIDLLVAGQAGPIRCASR